MCEAGQNRVCAVCAFSPSLHYVQSYIGVKLVVSWDVLKGRSLALLKGTRVSITMLSHVKPSVLALNIPC